MTRAMGANSNLLLPKGHPADNPCIIFQSEAYMSLLKSALLHSPDETVGALIGTMTRENSRETVKIEAIHPIRLIGRGLGLFPDLDKWEELRASLEKDASGRPAGSQCVVGWYFADPGLGLFPPRVEITLAHHALALDRGLLLLINPSTQEVGFCVGQAGALTSVGGFYEGLPNQHAESLIPGFPIITAVLGSIRAVSQDELGSPAPNPAPINGPRPPESSHRTAQTAPPCADSAIAGGFQEPTPRQNAARPGVASVRMPAQEAEEAPFYPAQAPVGHALDPLQSLLADEAAGSLTLGEPADAREPVPGARSSDESALSPPGRRVGPSCLTWVAAGWSCLPLLPCWFARGCLPRPLHGANPVPCLPSPAQP